MVLRDKSVCVIYVQHMTQHLREVRSSFVCEFYIHMLMEPTILETLEQPSPRQYDLILASDEVMQKKVGSVIF